jgi:hypothetical protein
LAQGAADAFPFGPGRFRVREAGIVMHLSRRFALGDRMLRFARTVGRTSRELGPYTAIALILPGGSLIALAAWTFRHRPVTAPLSRLLVMVAAFGAALIVPGSA